MELTLAQLDLQGVVVRVAFSRCHVDLAANADEGIERPCRRIARSRVLIDRFGNDEMLCDIPDVPKLEREARSDQCLEGEVVLLNQLGFDVRIPGFVFGGSSTSSNTGREALADMYGCSRVVAVGRVLCTDTEG